MKRLTKKKNGKACLIAEPLDYKFGKAEISETMKEAIERLAEYEDIGSIEEVRAAVEKRKREETK